MYALFFLLKLTNYKIFYEREIKDPVNDKVTRFGCREILFDVAHILVERLQSIEEILFSDSYEPQSKVQLVGKKDLGRVAHLWRKNLVEIKREVKGK